MAYTEAGKYPRARYLLQNINEKTHKQRETRMIYLEELIECEAFASRKEISIGTWSFESAHEGWY